ncbi:hypothetical protein FQN50_000224 [Emmonsiellopsis sp. PD_5]|nr:hypothetical protein FQN50_000224 [Emmonsiellopsis sp. PD_5]
MTAAPLQRELETDKTVVFHYINGPIEVNPPPGEYSFLWIFVVWLFTTWWQGSGTIWGYLGKGPHYRWADDGGNAESTILSRIQQFPVGQTSEDVMRALAPDAVVWRNHQAVVDYLNDFLDRNPEIEGIVGYSEGASMAAAFLLDEGQRLRETGRQKRNKCAMFFMGWPPVAPDDAAVLCDESDLVIDIPTLHVVGAYDPYRHGALALFNVCKPEKAQLFDTGKGHTVPRGGRVITELADAVREMIQL